MQRQEVEAIFDRFNLSYLGAVRLGPEPDFIRFTRWLEEGKHASMAFLEQNLALREDPSKLLPGAKQALIFGLSYFQGDKLQSTRQGQFQVAQYARLKDYHKLMRKRGELLLQELKSASLDLQARVVIDSAPLLERSLAARTSSGFIGKNTCYIHPQLGSFLLLGEILLNQEITGFEASTFVDPKQRTENGGCGSCSRCQVFCPTGALDSAYQLDARKCLAFWTIENRGPIPFEFWPWLKTYLFGCDLCQLACPYNRKSQVTREEVRSHLSSLDPYDVAVMSQARYEELFGGTPLTRAKRSGLRRNALIAMAVAKDERMDKALAAIEPEDSSVIHETAAQIKIFRSQGSPLRQP